MDGHIAALTMGDQFRAPPCISGNHNTPVAYVEPVTERLLAFPMQHQECGDTDAVILVNDTGFDGMRVDNKRQFVFHAF